MIDQILKSVKGELGSQLTSLGLPESKTSDAIKLAQDTVQDQLKGQVSSGNIAGLTSLFSGKTSMSENSLVRNMISDYGSKMVSNLGVSESVSKSISSFAIPFVMSKVSGSVAGGGESAIMKLVGGGDIMSKVKSFGKFFK